MTELPDDQVRKNDILSNRDKAQRLPGYGLDGKSVQVDEYKDNPANRRPAREDAVAAPDLPVTVETPARVDRPGADLGGATGTTEAGTGLGLGSDAAESRKARDLPR